MATLTLRLGVWGSQVRILSSRPIISHINSRSGGTAFASEALGLVAGWVRCWSSQQRHTSFGAGASQLKDTKDTANSCKTVSFVALRQRGRALNLQGSSTAQRAASAFAAKLKDALKSNPTLQGQRELRMSAFDRLRHVCRRSGHDNIEGMCIFSSPDSYMSIVYYGRK